MLRWSLKLPFVSVGLFVCLFVVIAWGLSVTGCDSGGRRGTCLQGQEELPQQLGANYQGQAAPRSDGSRTSSCWGTWRRVAPVIREGGHVCIFPQETFGRDIPSKQETITRKSHPNGQCPALALASFLKVAFLLHRECPGGAGATRENQGSRRGMNPDSSA